MRALWIAIMLLELAAAVVWSVAAYHAFSDPSGGVLQGCIAILLGICVFAVVAEGLWEIRP